MGVLSRKCTAFWYHHPGFGASKGEQTMRFNAPSPSPSDGRSATSSRSLASVSAVWAAHCLLGRVQEAAYLGKGSFKRWQLGQPGARSGRGGISAFLDHVYRTLCAPHSACRNFASSVIGRKGRRRVSRGNFCLEESFPFSGRGAMHPALMRTSHPTIHRACNVEAIPSMLSHCPA